MFCGVQFIYMPLVTLPSSVVASSVSYLCQLCGGGHNLESMTLAVSLRCVQPDSAPPLPEQLLEALGVSSPTTIPPGFLDDFAAKYADEGLEDVVEQVGALDGAPLTFDTVTYLAVRIYTILESDYQTNSGVYWVFLTRCACGMQCAACWPSFRGCQRSATSKTL